MAISNKYSWYTIWQTFAVHTNTASWEKHIHPYDSVVFTSSANEFIKSFNKRHAYDGYITINSN